MAVTDQQKLDFLLKKIGYTKTKTGSVVGTGAISGTPKQPFAEAIPSPLIIANGALWNEADSIPATPPGADTTQVKVYLAATSGLRMTADATSSGQRAYIAYSTYGNTSSTRLTNWIDTQFGASYIIKVYRGDPNSGGVNLSAAGSGANDGWFFDYSAGVLNFNDTNVPSGVTDTNIYIVGYRYIGQTGAPTSGISTFSFKDLTVERNLDVGIQGGISTFRNNIDLNADLDVDGHTNLDNVSVAGVSTFSDNLKIIDDKKIIVGNGQGGANDLEIFHQSSNNYNYIKSPARGFIIQNASMNATYIAANYFNLTNANLSQTYATANNYGINLRYNNDQKLRTASSGIQVIGVTTTTGLAVTGVSTFTGNIDANGDLDVDGHTNLDNVSVSGVSTFSNNVRLLDNDKLQFGDSQDLSIYHNGTHHYVDGVGSANLIYRVNQVSFMNGAGTKAKFNLYSNGQAVIYHDHSQKFTTTSTGISITGNNVVSGNVSAVDATFTGNVSIGGTLTYEDVQNVDAVGLITARSGIRVTGGVIEAQAGENKIPSLYAAMGNLPSAGSYHGMFAHVHATGRGYFAHAGNWLELVNKEINGVVGTGTERYNIGPVDLTTLDVSGISTFAGNVDINADIDVDGHTNLDNVSIVGVTTLNLTNHPEPLKIISNNTGGNISTYLFTTNAGLHDIRFEHYGGGNWNNRDHMRLIWSAPNETTQYTTGELFSIQPKSGVPGFTHVEFKLNDESTGLVDSYRMAYEYHQWRIRNSVVLNLNQAGIGVTNRIYHYGYNNDFIQFGHHNMTFHIGSATDRRVLIQSNQVQFSNLAQGVDINADLDVDGHTNLDNVSIAGVTTAFRIRLEDNRYLQIGNDSDLQLYHDGTNSYINEGGTGSLFIAGSALRLQSNDNRLNDANGNVIIKTDATSAYLYYEGSNRLNTTSVGINIPQDLDVDGHTNLDNVSIVGVATVTGSNINIEGGSTALTQLKINSTGRYRGIQLDENGTRKAHFQHDATDNKTIVGTAEGTLQFNSGDTPRVILNSSGHWVPYVDSTYDLGLTGTRWRNVYADTFVGNANIGIITATSIDLNGDLDVDGHTNLDNVSVAGITTFHDDVTFTTANNKNIVFDKSANDLTFGDNTIARFGDSNDLSIYHDSTSSNILDSFGGLNIRSNGLSLKNAAANSNYLQALNGSHVKLYFAGNEKLSTTTTGINVTGLTETDTFLSSGNARFNGTIAVHDGTTGSNGQYLSATGAGVTWANFPTMRTGQTFTASAGQTTFSFTYNVGFLDVYVNGIKLSSSEFTANNGTSVVLSVGCFVGDIVELISFFTTSYASGLSGINNIVEDTTPQLGGNLDLFNKNITGTGNINITGTVTANSFVGDGSGLTGITASGSGVVIKNNGSTVGTAGTINFGDNLSVSPASAGIVTITSGVSTAHVRSNTLTVSGISTFSDDVQIPLDDKKLIVGADSDLELFHTGGNSIIKNTTSGSLLIHGNTIDLRPTTESGEVMLRATRNGSVELRHDNVKKFETRAGGATVSGTINATGGSFTGNLRFSSNVGTLFGPSDELQVFHSSGTSYISHNGSGQLQLRAKHTEHGIKIFPDGAVELYHDNVKRLETSSVGVSIPQDLDVDGHTNLDNVNIAGVVTATTFKGSLEATSASFSSNIDANGDLDVDGHTNLDNVSVAGVTTFASNVNLGDNDKVIMGADSDLQLFHDGSNAVLQNNTGTTFIIDDRVDFQSSPGAARNLSVDGLNVRLPQDNAILNIGASDDLKLIHNGTDTFIDNNQGDFYLQTTSNGDDIILQSKDDVEIQVNGGASAIYAEGGGSVYIKWNNSNRIITTSAGVSITNDLDVDGHTNLDNVSVVGVVTVAGNVTAHDFLPDSNAFRNIGTSSKKFNQVHANTFIGNGDFVELDVDGHTNLDNVSVAGVVTATTFVGDGSGLTGITASGSGVVIKHDGSTVGTAGTINFGTNLDVSAISGGAVTITASGGSGSGISTISGVVNIVNDLDVDGHTNLDNVSIVGVTTTTGDINIDADNKILKIGDGQDLQLVHTGTYSNIYNATGDLDISSNVIRLKNGNRSETFAAFINGGQAELYYDNSRKITTTSTGINVTGNVVGDGLTIDGNSDLNGDLDVDGHTNLDNVSIAGVCTATSFVGDGSNLTGVNANVGITTNLSGTFTASAGSPSTINTFGYGSGDIVVEYTVFIKNGSDFQSQKLLAMRDGTTIHSTQFAVMYSSSLLVQLDATISSGNILLRATPETGVSGSTTYKVKREVM